LRDEDIKELIRSNNIEEYLEKREKNLPAQWINPPIIDERLINPITYKKILVDLGFECVKISVVSYSYLKISLFLNWLKIGIFISPTFILNGSKRRVQI
jgi:hypothetical protein